MIIKSILTVLIVYGAVSVGVTQSKLPSTIKLRWTVLENNHSNSERTLSELTLFNRSNSTLPTNGWQIYFNNGDPRVVDHDSSLFKIRLINGDFYVLGAEANQKQIKAGDSVKFQVLSKPILNLSDYPTGFYMVREDPEQTIEELDVDYVYGVNIIGREKQIANQTYEKVRKIQAISPSASRSKPAIFPTPLSVTYMKDEFVLDGETKIYSTYYSKEAQLLQTELDSLLVKRRQKDTLRKNTIELKHRPELLPEAYMLTISGSKIVLEASSTSGMFYAIQSLKTLLPPRNWNEKTEKVALPTMRLKDEPRFGHRAFMMDIARNFQPKTQILKVLDLLALYKINRLHFHLNDDEGWRIAINGLPELTEVGSKRGHTVTEENYLLPAYGSGWQTNNSTGTGFLSRADFIEILRYAKDRHIQVIPEFETPGHARAAIKSMDARYARLIKLGKQAKAEEYLLRDLHDQSTYRSIQGFNDNVINPALPSVYRFLEKLIDETVAMYKEADAPLHTIHFGGDEVPSGVWEKSPAVDSLLKADSGIKNVNELWYYYFNKLNALLEKKGLYLSGWEEIALKKELWDGKKQMVLDPRFADKNFHVDVWNNLSGNEDLAYKLANMGYKVILTNVTNLYLDLAYNSSYHEIGQYWGGFVDIDKPFDFVPLNYYQTQSEDQYGKSISTDRYKGMALLTKEGRKNIMGIQSPLWSEVLTTQSEFEYMLVPKLLSFAERAWNGDPCWAVGRKDDKRKAQQWAQFVGILDSQELPRMQHYAGGFFYRIPTPGYIIENNKVFANSLYASMEIRYSTDGNVPSASSAVFSSGMPFQSGMMLRIFDQSGRGGRAVHVCQ